MEKRKPNDLPPGSAWLLIPIPFANCCAVEGTLQYRLGILPMHALP